MYLAEEGESAGRCREHPEPDLTCFATEALSLCRDTWGPVPLGRVYSFDPGRHCRQPYGDEVLSIVKSLLADSDPKKVLRPIFWVLRPILWVLRPILKVLRHGLRVYNARK